MNNIDRKQISGMLFGDDSEVRHNFIKIYSAELEHFVELMAYAFEEWHRVDKIFIEKKQASNAYVSAVLYSALHSHVMSMKLFISGLIVPSGNTQRYTYESIALALLLSRPSLNILERYMKDEYSTNKAIRDLVRNHEKLVLDREALKTLETSAKFYDKFSHPTPLSLSGVLNLNGSDIIFGGAYDEAKELSYSKEINSKLAFAEILPNFIVGVEENYLIEA